MFEKQQRNETNRQIENENEHENKNENENEKERETESQKGKKLNEEAFRNRLNK